VVAASKKARVVFVCQACGHQSPKWLGRCPGCDTWSSLVEEAAPQSSAQAAQAARKSGRVGGFAQAQRLADIGGSDTARLTTGIAELDRVLGGGLVSGALMLVGGDPGIGKSTLLLQACGELAARGQKLLYVTAEESPRQVSCAPSVWA
jgi:DNA repair protein RadA/Sms